MDYDFSGWATKSNILCSDGKVISDNAFASCDGACVPLVWNHQHNDINNVLGHAYLQNTGNGVYAYGVFNDSPAGQQAKCLVKNGDVRSLSIFANRLKKDGRNVTHGKIIEVSLVLAGANPKAFIDTVVRHGEEFEDEAVIYFGENIYLEHSDDAGEYYNDEYYEDQIEERYFYHSEENNMNENERTIKQVFDGFTEEEKTVVYALIGMAVENAGGGKNMKHNVFDNYYDDYYDGGEVLSHSDMAEIIGDAKRYGSLRESVLAHGIEQIDYLFPDATMMENAPEFIKRTDEWVDKVMKSTHHTPFSRIKSMFADITKEDARARGYVKGNRKVDEVFGLLKRSTSPTTIYKKQKIDRDDVIDITDFDVVSWLKTEMRGMLDEEIARAILIGDGRPDSSDDKISEMCIRPIWTDDELFTVKKDVQVSATSSDEAKAKAFIRAVIRSRKDYRGSGNPTLFISEDMLTSCLLIEDTNQRVIYDSMDKLKTALRVKDIVTVPVFENMSREVNGTEHFLAGIYLNMSDYNVGADKGGSVNMFDDFDIDYNAQKYLIETRCSGALTKPFSAVAIEFVYTDSIELKVEPEDDDEEILGKYVSGLQDNVSVGKTSISGTLKWVTGYTGFSGKAEEQSGNYLALKIEDSEDAVTTVELVGGTSGPKTLDVDKNVVLRITNKSSQSVRVVSSKNGIVTTKNFGLSGLRLMSA